MSGVEKTETRVENGQTVVVETVLREDGSRYEAVLSEAGGLVRFRELDP